MYVSPVSPLGGSAGGQPLESQCSKVSDPDEMARVIATQAIELSILREGIESIAEVDTEGNYVATQLRAEARKARKAAKCIGAEGLIPRQPEAS